MKLPLPHRWRFLAGAIALIIALTSPQAQATTAPVTKAVPASSTDLATLVNVHIFNAPDGQNPGNTLTVDGAGNVYGTAQNGGAYNSGTVYRLAPDGTITTLHSFGAVLDGNNSADGRFPVAAPLLGADGNLYGTTTGGGTTNNGTIYRLNPATGALTTVASFDGATTGSDPEAPLKSDGNGNFYGVTVNGGPQGEGTLFVFNATTGTLTVPVSFNYSNGANPQAALLRTVDGLLYGLTRTGGSIGYGTVFQFNPATGVLTTLQNFDYSNTGGYLYGQLATDGNGHFFGTANQGGSSGYGTAFELTVDNTAATPTATFLKLYDFARGDGRGYNPQGGLVFGADGNLYGTTTYSNTNGPGTVFQLILPVDGATTATVNILYSFIIGNDGGYTDSNLTVDAAGNLFGTSRNYGVNQEGTVFKLTPTTTATPFTYTFGVLYSFLRADGINPSAPLLTGADGNLYGTTQGGGTGNGGTAYVYSPTTGVTTTLHNFTGNNGGIILLPNAPGAVDGSDPFGKLVEAAPGVFLGTTISGGTNNAGTVFRLNTATDAATGAITGTVTVLSSFTGTAPDGANPQSGLTLAADGNFYGTTVNGGANNYGAVFQFNPATGTVATVASFNRVNGRNPGAELVLAANNVLYGTTSSGGGNNDGTVFSFDPAAGNLAVVANFNGTNGEFPVAALTQGADGLLYGTTSQGGTNGRGTLFQVDPATNGLTTLVNFGTATGSRPQGTPVQAADGNFYGTTTNDGNNGEGTAFQFNPNTGALVTLLDFGGAAGTRAGSLTLADNGNLYGTTDVSSGNIEDGVVGVPHPNAVTGPSAANDANGSIFELIVIPTITSGTTTVGTVNTPFSFQVTGTFNPTAFTATGLPAGLTIDAATGVISGTPTATGTSKVTVTVSNAGGTATQTLTIVIQPPATTSFPAITSGAPPAGQVGVAYAYQITASNTPTSFGASGLPPGLTINPATGLVSGTPTTAGSYGVTFVATNSAGTGTASSTLNVVSGAPVITSATSASAQAGTAFSYVITALGNPTSFAATGLPAGLTVDAATGVISGTPTATGTFNVMLSASNGTGTGVGPLALTVTAVAANAPTVTSPASASAQAGQVFAYQVTASNRPTSYGATGLPSGLTINTATGLLSGTPTMAGTYTVTLSATNASGTNTSSLTLTVTAAVVALPAINSAGSQDGQVAVAFAYQITAANNPVFFGATGLPAGLSINDATGVIAGTPTAAGTFTVNLMATNSAGTTNAPLTLTIAAQPLPVITIVASIPSVTLGTGQLATFAVTRTGGDPTQVLPVNYSVAGTATAGVDYLTLKGVKTFKENKTTVRINVTPEGTLNGALKKTVKVTLQPGDGYTLGASTVARVKILAAP